MYLTTLAVTSALAFILLRIVYNYIDTVYYKNTETNRKKLITQCHDYMIHVRSLGREYTDEDYSELYDLSFNDLYYKHKVLRQLYTICVKLRILAVVLVLLLKDKYNISKLDSFFENKRQEIVQMIESHKDNCLLDITDAAMRLIIEHVAEEYVIVDHDITSVKELNKPYSNARTIMLDAHYLLSTAKEYLGPKV